MPKQKGGCVLRPSAATALAPGVTQCKVGFPKNSSGEQHLGEEIDKMRNSTTIFFSFTIIKSHWKIRADANVWWLVKGEYSSSSDCPERSFSREC